ncbi:hypothetical protein D3C78_1750600 [compost metagenome]
MAHLLPSKIKEPAKIQTLTTSYDIILLVQLNLGGKVSPPDGGDAHAIFVFGSDYARHVLAGFAHLSA